MREIKRSPVPVLDETLEQAIALRIAGFGVEDLGAVKSRLSWSPDGWMAEAARRIVHELLEFVPNPPDCIPEDDLRVPAGDVMQALRCATTQKKEEIRRAVLFSFGDYLRGEA
jgi:hypothetical protein